MDWLELPSKAGAAAIPCLEAPWENLAGRAAGQASWADSTGDPQKANPYCRGTSQPERCGADALRSRFSAQTTKVHRRCDDQPQQNPIQSIFQHIEIACTTGQGVLPAMVPRLMSGGPRARVPAATLHDCACASLLDAPAPCASWVLHGNIFQVLHCILSSQLLMLDVSLEAWGRPASLWTACTGTQRL